MEVPLYRDIDEDEKDLMKSLPDMTWSVDNENHRIDVSGLPDKMNRKIAVLIKATKGNSMVYKVDRNSRRVNINGNTAPTDPTVWNVRLTDVGYYRITIPPTTQHGSDADDASPPPNLRIEQIEWKEDDFRKYKEDQSRWYRTHDHAKYMEAQDAARARKVAKDEKYAECAAIKLDSLMRYVDYSLCVAQKALLH